MWMLSQEVVLEVVLESEQEMMSEAEQVMGPDRVVGLAGALD